MSLSRARSDGLVKGAQVQIVAPPHNSKRALASNEVFDQTGVITREGSSANGGWFEIMLDNDKDRRVYYRRGALRMLRSGGAHFQLDDDASAEPQDMDADSQLSDESDSFPFSHGSPQLQVKSHMGKHAHRAPLSVGIELDIAAPVSPADNHVYSPVADPSAAELQDARGEAMPAYGKILIKDRKVRRKPVHPTRSTFLCDEFSLYPWDFHSVALAWPLAAPRAERFGDGLEYLEHKAARSHGLAPGVVAPAGLAASVSAAAAAAGAGAGAGGMPICASCKTDRSPYWHKEHTNDLGILMCNACGIRYKKYKSHCLACHYVLRREEQGVQACPQCSCLVSVHPSSF